MKRLLFLLVVSVSAFACDRSTPSLESAPTASPGDTQAPVIGTRPPNASPRTARLPTAPADAVDARVLRVTDGDTIVLSGIDVGEVDRSTGGRKARLIGVDTPEVSGGVECFGRKASAFTERELDGERVLVDLDVDPVDRYGRALVYVWKTDGSFFNATLVTEGYANQATFPPNVRYAELFTRLARDARTARRGLWKECF